VSEETTSVRLDKVLIVDDTAANLQLLTSLLTEQGYQVYPASDGALALRFVQSIVPDLILLDIRMPGMDGYEVCRRLKADERTQSTPVIFISVLEDERDKVRGFQAGGVDYITKPFNPEEVSARVRLHLRLRDLTVRLEQQVRERTDELARANQQLVRELAERQQAERMLRARDPRLRSLLDAARPAPVALLSILEDEKRAKEELRRANRALRAISDCNEAVIHATDEAELMSAVCRVVVESGEYRAAWIGFAEEDAACSVRPMAQAGLDTSVLETLELSRADSERDQGTIGRAIRTRQDCVGRAAEDDPVLAWWRAREATAAPACVLSLPLCVSEKCLGTLAIYADAADAFDTRETGLLSEMAGDLAYGIETLRTRAARAQAEADLRLFRQLTNQSNDAIFVIEPQTGRVLDSNDTAARILGYTRDELLNLRVADFDMVMRDALRWDEHLRAVRASGAVTLESTHERKDGTTFPVEVSINHTVLEQRDYLIAVIRDITERKQAQDALQRSSDLLRAIIEAAPTAIIGLDLEGNVSTVWNPAAERMLGWTAQEVVGRPLPTVPAGSQAEFARFRDQIRAGMTLDGVEVRRQKRDGTAIDYCIYASPLHDSAGHISGNVAVLVDTTERKRAEETLRDSEQRWRSLLQTVEVGVVIHDPQSRVVACNIAAQALLGLTEQQMLGKAAIDPAWRFVQEDGTPMPVELFPVSQVASDGRAVRSLVVGVVRPDRLAATWALVNADPVFYPDGSLREVIVAFMDITERKQAEEKLRAKTEELDHFFNLSLDLLCIADTDGYFTRLNPSWERTLGYPLAELQGPRFFDFVHPEDVAPTQEVVATLAAQHGVTDFVNRYRCVDGSYRWLEWRSAPVGKRIYAVARDITERREAQEALLRSERQKTILNRIASIVLAVPDDEMYGDVLNVVLEVLDSEHGVFGLISDNEDLVIPSMTRDVWSRCQVPDKSIVFPKSSWGDSLWGRAIREKTSFVSDGPLHTPAGHLPIATFLTTPVVFGGRSIGLLSVANRAGGYSRDAAALLESISEYLAPILNARLQHDRHERERKRAEERIAGQLREKEMLLREIHHRVKNNLQVISSLLDLQARQVGSEALHALLNTSRGRLRTMALVHERLYAAQDMARVDLRDYIRALVTESLSLYGVDAAQVEVRVNVEQWTLAIATAIPCGLIIHELLSNALRHAFPGGRPGHVGISLVRTGDGSVELAVEDDGVGVPKDFDFGRTESLGLRLVRILAVDQLGGTVSMGRETGTRVHVRFTEVQS